MTCDMFGGWTFSQNFSSLALTVDLWYYEDLEENADSVNQLINELINKLINDETVYKTAPATPGVLIIHSRDKAGIKFTIVQ